MQRLVGKPYVELILTCIDHWMSLSSTAGRWEPTHLNFPVRHAGSLQLRIRRQCAYGIASSHVRFSDVAGRLEFVWWRDRVITCAVFWFSASDFFPTFCPPALFVAMFWGEILRQLSEAYARNFLSTNPQLIYTDRCLFSQVCDRQVNIMIIKARNASIHSSSAADS